MNELLVTGITGAILLVFGLAMIRSHRQSWAAQKNDAELPEAERVYLYRRYRRRMQTSAMLVVLGILIALGDALVPWRNLPPIAYFIYWGGVLLLTLWVILLAFGDMASTRVHARISLAQVQEKRRQLEQELAEYRNRRSNGRESGS